MVATANLERVPSGPVLGRRSLGRLFALLLFPVSVFGQAGKQITFWFQSGFWINLHHFLFQQAGESAAGGLAPPTALAPPESKAWRTAVDYYRNEFDGRDLLERDIAAIKNALSDAGNARSLDASGLEEELVRTLEAAAPVYRGHWWRMHDRSNRFRMDQLVPLVTQHEAWLKDRLSDVYQTKWPGTRLRTDVVFHANWAGAYTTLYPTRITISSKDSDQPPTESLEILFHEASHALIDIVRESISQRVRSLRKLLPRRSLWHALLFYSTGEIVRQRVPNYVPYAARHGLWQRAWPDHFEALEKEWKPYLEGDREFADAINALVDALAFDQ